LWGSKKEPLEIKGKSFYAQKDERNQKQKKKGTEKALPAAGNVLGPKGGGGTMNATINRRRCGPKGIAQ